MILCIGLAADDTFCHTLLALKQSGVEFDIIDFAQLVYSGELELSWNDLMSSTILLHDKTYILRVYESAWIRLIDIAAEAPDERLKWRAAEFYRALNLLFSNSPLRVMSPPLQDCSNFSKLYHAVALAAIGGWYIPRSCLTNSRDNALKFIASCQAGVIFKGSSAVKTWVTLYNVEQHLERMQWLNSCPVLFEERIDGPDVRVHVVGERLFAEMIESPELDYRLGRNNTYHRIDLPTDITQGCLALAEDCGIPFLGIDFKIQRTTGIWYFLEANSLPSYQGYDRRTGGAISSAIVGWLTQSGH
jgi:hypothetical protein